VSTAFVFLAVAIGAAAAASAILWLVSGRNRGQAPDYQEQLRAIAPRPDHQPIEQPRGVVPLEDLGDEEY
jgi:hypothetical protein